MSKIEALGNIAKKYIITEKMQRNKFIRKTGYVTEIIVYYIIFQLNSLELPKKY